MFLAKPLNQRDDKPNYRYEKREGPAAFCPNKITDGMPKHNCILSFDFTNSTRFSHLLPRLHEFLNAPRWWCPVLQPTTVMSCMVEIAKATNAHGRELALKVRQVVFRENRFGDWRLIRHDNRLTQFAFCSLSIIRLAFMFSITFQP